MSGVLEAELPPQPELKVSLSLRVTDVGLVVVWQGGGRRGMVAGAPVEVARAVAAAVLRLAGCDTGPDPLDETRRTEV